MADPAYQQLLVLQELDTKLDQLRYKHVNHPIRAEIVGLVAKQEDLQQIVDEIEGRQHELGREQKRFDDQVGLLDDKRTKIDAKLYDGSVTATKDLLLIQEEAAMLLERKTGLEDEELEVMEKAEEVAAELAPVASTMESLVAAQSATEDSLTVAIAELEVEIQGTDQQRSEAAALVPEELFGHYQTLRKDFGGVAVARLVGSTCDGCHMALSAVAIDKIKKLPDDAVVTCDQCGRLLIR